MYILKKKEAENKWENRVKNPNVSRKRCKCKDRERNECVIGLL